MQPTDLCLSSASAPSPRAPVAPRRSRVRRGVSLALMLALGSACGGDSETSDASSSTQAPERTLITADWLSGTLSFVDFDALVGEATRAEATFGSMDLSEYVPGPLALELTPDKKRLLVACSAGFFGVPLAGQLLLNEPNVTAGPGKFVVVDLETQTVEAALDTGEGAMGIAVTPDGTRAFVTHFDSGNMAIVDLTTLEIVDDIEIGQFAEEVVFDDTGTVGVVGYSASGWVRTFAVDDPAGTLSSPVEFDRDSAGIAFFPGTKVAYYVLAPNPVSVALGNVSSGYALLDVEDPTAPRVLEDVSVPKVVGAYPAHAAPNRGTVLVPAAEDGVFAVREYALENNAVKLVQDIPVGQAEFLGALGFAYDGKDTVVLAVPGQRSVIITNLDTKATRTVDWEQSSAGPADVVFR